MIELGVVERHYLKCPVCPDSRARLDTHVCPGCGAEAVAVQWLLPARVARERSPELAMVEWTNNMGGVA